MTAAAGERSGSDGNSAPRRVSAGRVGRAHGLDGSFYVTGARARLLALGTPLTVGEGTRRIVRRAGTNEHPIVRLEGIEDRAAAEAMRGLELGVEEAHAPVLGEGEWWASELEGCEVFDGARHVGTVARLVELPSCEALEVRLATPPSEGAGGSANAKTIDGAARELLVPMVRDAIRSVDGAARRIDVDMSFLEDA